MQNRHSCLRFLVTAVVLLVGAAYAEDASENPPFQPWIKKPSPRLEEKLRHWRLQFASGEVQNAPEKGLFPSFTPDQRGGTARVISDLKPPPLIRLRPVAPRTRYLREGDPPTEPDEKVVTKDLMDALRSPETARFITARRLDNAQLQLDRDIAVVLVQDFEATLRTPKRKEHVWSINWRVEHRTTTSYAGYEAWGLFTRVNGMLKPFYLAGARSSGETPMASYYYFLAVGDLNGDGVDELVVREVGFEKEEDDLEIWAWERGAPVQIHRITSLVQ
jgi:hypothetical protein